MAEVNGVTIASIYVPNGGKDLGVKLRFLEAMQDFARVYQKDKKPLLLCGDFNVAHTPMDVHPKERKVTTGQLPIERTALDDILARNLVDLGRQAAPDDDGLFTLVGAVARNEAAQHRLAPRLHLRQPVARRDDDLLRGAKGNRHE